jgi:hypothetical protein
MQRQRRITFELWLPFLPRQSDVQNLLVQTIADFKANKKSFEKALQVRAEDILETLFAFKELFLNIGESAAADLCQQIHSRVKMSSSMFDRNVYTDLLLFVDVTVKELERESV